MHPELDLVTVISSELVTHQNPTPPNKNNHQQRAVDKSVTLRFLFSTQKWDNHHKLME